MLTEHNDWDQISITRDGIILVRTKSRILKDGVERAYSYHRTSYEPGSDLNGAEKLVQALGALVWTPSVLAAWKQRLAERA